jgi:Cu-Zn family superoxide dismutase
MKQSVVVVVSVIGLGVASAVVARDHHANSAARGSMAPSAGPVTAVAVLQPKSGSQVNGTVTFTQQGNRVIVVADVRGLPPNTAHGFHVHEKGDCSSPDAMSAGGHFNPGAHPHAGPNTANRHAGDLGNLETGASGRAYKRMVVDNITLDHGTSGVLGRAVIVHEKADDFTTQPSGNAGARVACGVIEASQPSTDRSTRRR